MAVAAGVINTNAVIPWFDVNHRGWPTPIRGELFLHIPWLEFPNLIAGTIWDKLLFLVILLFLLFFLPTYLLRNLLHCLCVFGIKRLDKVTNGQFRIG